jgi:hypothetical protein
MQKPSGAEFTAQNGLLCDGSANDYIDPSAPTLAAQKPGVPVRDAHLGTLARSHLGRVGLDLVPAIEAPHDQPHVRQCGVAERHGWAVVPVHR